MEIGSSKAGALIPARVRPRSRPRLEVGAEWLIIGVGAAPVGGKATEEARRALAEALEVSTSTVTLHSGARSRTKVFLVHGLGVEEAASRLAGFGRKDRSVRA